MSETTSIRNATTIAEMISAYHDITVKTKTGDKIRGLFSKRVLGTSYRSNFDGSLLQYQKKKMRSYIKYNRDQILKDLNKLFAQRELERPDLRIVVYTNAEMKCGICNIDFERKYFTKIVKEYDREHNWSTEALNEMIELLINMQKIYDSDSVDFSRAEKKLMNFGALYGSKNVKLVGPVNPVLHLHKVNPSLLGL